MTTTLAKKQPQFRDITFSNVTKFHKWLEENTSVKLHLQDFGQDLLTVWLHSSGEILNTDMQGSIWCGRFINLDNLHEGAPIEMWIDNEWKTMNRLIVDSFKKLK